MSAFRYILDIGEGMAQPDRGITQMFKATFTIAGHGPQFFHADDLAGVRAAWSAFCAQIDIGASAMAGNGPVLHGNKLIGWMSYNGKVWPRRDWHPGDVPVEC